eukprot:TRINITY_DN98923_c0_g1_i1.p1 TRINITY_DN98923_c0_g1~~TRINITY_DN98923_c0_g1_i1.p1  ORF type:complete len:221 (-),score=47.87 TRINITY_DN98923_c0_g1_i1:66-728(-)
MFTFTEACAEDEFPAVCPPGEDDVDPSDGWELDFFPQELVRPEIRFFAGVRPDVALCCRGGRKLLVHRHVLSEVAYFESLFEGNFAERGTDSLDVDEDVDIFLELVRWIYCRSASCDKEKAADLLRLAEFYGIDGLIDHAARVLAAPEMGAKSQGKVEGGDEAIDPEVESKSRPDDEASDCLPAENSRSANATQRELPLTGSAEANAEPKPEPPQKCKNT